MYVRDILRLHFHILPVELIQLKCSELKKWKLFSITYERQICILSFNTVLQPNYWHIHGTTLKLHICPHHI